MKHLFHSLLCVTLTLCMMLCIVPASAEVDTEGALLSFAGDTLTAVCYADGTAKICDTATGEVKLETAFSYTRTKSNGAGGQSGIVFGDDELDGPVIYLHYPDTTADYGWDVCARSVLTADGMTMAFDFDGLTDTFVIPESTWSVLNSGKLLLTCVGANTPYEFHVEFYEGGLVSAYALRDGNCDEITPGFYGGDPETPYGGGQEGKDFQTGFWFISEDPDGVLEADGKTYTLTVIMDGYEEYGEVTADGSLSVYTAFAMSTYKKSANNTAAASAWQSALLGLASEKAVFEGCDYRITCMSDGSVSIVSWDDEDTVIAVGTWTYADETVTITLEDGTEMVSEAGERLVVTYEGDECESGLSWKEDLAG